MQRGFFTVFHSVLLNKNYNYLYRMPWMKTSDDDPALYYRSRFLKHAYFYRVRSLLRLMHGYSFEHVLEIGFGSGVLLPALKQQCRILYGIDTHEHVADIGKTVHPGNGAGALLRGSALQLPFKSESMNAVVVLSVLEFVSDLEDSVREISRVLAKDGFLFLGAPAINFLTAFFYHHVTGYAEHAVRHKHNHNEIICSISRQFAVEKCRPVPFFFPFNYAMFFTLRARKT